MCSYLHHDVPTGVRLCSLDILHCDRIRGNDTRLIHHLVFIEESYYNGTKLFLLHRLIDSNICGSFSFANCLKMSNIS